MKNINEIIYKNENILKLEWKLLKFSIIQDLKEFWSNKNRYIWEVKKWKNWDILAHWQWNKIINNIDNTQSFDFWYYENWCILSWQKVIIKWETRIELTWFFDKKWNLIEWIKKTYNWLGIIETENIWENNKIKEIVLEENNMVYKFIWEIQKNEKWFYIIWQWKIVIINWKKIIIAKWEFKNWNLIKWEKISDEKRFFWEFYENWEIKNWILENQKTNLIKSWEFKNWELINWEIIDNKNFIYYLVKSWKIVEKIYFQGNNKIIEKWNFMSWILSEWEKEICENWFLFVEKVKRIIQ